MEKLLNLFQQQKEVIDSNKRFIVAISGIQGGKTTIGAMWMCKKIYDNFIAKKTGSDYLIAAPTEKILQQSTLPKFKSILPKDWAVWHENRKVFELKWGDRIFVRSTDEPEHLEGMTLLGAWLDEAGQMKQQVWINMQGRTAIHQAPILFTTTPYNMGWFYRELIKTAEINKDIDVISWASVDNPAFPKEEFERAKATLPQPIFERRYLGKFTQLEGLVYPDFNDNVVVNPFDIPDTWEKFGGMDFGQTNPTAIVCVAHDPSSDVYYVYKEFYRSEQLLEQSANFIKSNGLKYVLADPQSAQLIVELNRHHSVGNVKQAENDINTGIQRLASLFKAQRLKVFKSCDNLIDELESYHYPSPDSEGEVKDKPVAKHNHACDALRYAFSKFQEKVIYRHPSFNPLEVKGGKKRYYPQVTRRDLIYDKYTGYC